MARPAGARAGELARQLYAEGNRIDATGRQITLAQSLANRSSKTRELVDVYWQASERAGRYRALFERQAQLAALQPLVLEARTSPGGPELMLQLRAVLLEAQADLLDGEIAMLAAAFELASIAAVASTTPTTAKAAGKADFPLMIPVTPPHAGSFRVDPRSAASNASHAARSAGKSISIWHAALTDRAEAVVRADVLRAVDTHQLLQGRQACEVVLADIERQAAAILSFLETLRRYNLGIADYVLATAPQARGEQLAALLVAQKP
jgi:hypothetical protein